MLRRFLHSFTRSARNSKRRPTGRRLRLLERLEQRELLTAVPTFTSFQASPELLIYG
jgi:hypothetical protein